jgi:hypothetical protein
LNSSKVRVHGTEIGSKSQGNRWKFARFLQNYPYADRALACLHLDIFTMIPKNLRIWAGGVFAHIIVPRGVEET